MKNFFSAFVVAALFTGLLSSCHKRVDRYYLDAAAGNDSRNGSSPAEAWRTLERAGKAIYSPGSQLLLKAGSTFHGTLDLTNIRGKEDDPIVIKSYGAGKATIFSGDSAAIKLRDCEYIQLKNIKCDGSGRLSGNKTSGVVVRNARKIEVDSLEVSGYLYSGIEVRGGSHISLTRVFAHDNGSCGIYVDADYEAEEEGVQKPVHDVYIAYCLALNNPGCPAITDNHSGNGILIGGVTKGLIEYCEASNNGWDMPRPGNGPVGIWAYESDSIIIQHCYSHHNKTSPRGADGGGFDFDGGVTNSIMQNNFSAYNEGAGYGMFQYAGAGTWSNNILRFNISFNDGIKNGNCGIFMWCDPAAVSMKNLQASHNTVVNSFGHGVNFLPGNYEGFVFEYNIFMLLNRSSIFTGGRYSGAVFNHNLYWNTYHAKAGLAQPEVYPDKQAIVSDPLILLPDSSDLESIAWLNKDRIPFFLPAENSPARLNGEIVRGDTSTRFYAKKPFRE